MFSFFCRVISHMYIVISLKRLQNAETINNKKIEIYTQICKRNGTNSQHEKHSGKYRMCSILITHVPDSRFEKGLFRMKNDQNVPYPN